MAKKGIVFNGIAFHLTVLLYLLCSTYACWAQVDTLTIYDTVYEHRDPVIISHKVYDRSFPNKNSPNWTLGIHYLVGGTLYEPSDLKASDGRWHQTGLEISRKVFKGFFVGVGIGYQQVNDNLSVHDTTWYYQQQKHITYDTLTQYYDDGEVKYVVDVHEETTTERNALMYNRNVTRKVDYMEIPLRLGYEWQWKNYRAYFTLVTVLSKLLTETTSAPTYHTDVMKYGGTTGIQYHLKKNLAIGFNGSYSRTTTSVLKTAPLFRQQLGGGFMLHYFF